MEKEKVADALKSRTVISPFSFLLSHFKNGLLA